MNPDAGIPRDSQTISPWQKNFANVEKSEIPEPGAVYDVIIIGAGITGLTTALLLQQEGKKCIILEGRQIGFGTSGGTTAHINTFYDTAYSDVEKDFGADAAVLFADAAKTSISIVQDLIRRYDIDCDFECKDGIVFAENEHEDKALLKNMEAGRRAGVDVVEVRENDVPIPFEVAVLYKDQAQFHPLKYCYGLAQAFLSLGGILLENAFVQNTRKTDAIHIADVGDIEIQGLALVYATHMPPGLTIFNAECAAYRSYVLGIRLKNGDYPASLVYDSQDPYHYLRTHIIDGQPYLILGGADHKTGHGDPESSFAELEAYARKYYYVESIDYKWSAQYYQPVDGLPFIGEMPASDGQVYVATGYNGNGMMLGTIAGQVIADAILKKDNPYQELFNPARVKPVAGFTDFVTENADVVYHMLADRLLVEDMDNFKDLPADTGEVLDYKGKQVAAYKDAAGKLSLLSPTCTHAGCIVKFNKAEKSWDCPCHGGRYNLEGEVLCGPPRKNLDQILIRG